jgi:hypothetical protein
MKCKVNVELVLIDTLSPYHHRVVSSQLGTGRYYEAWGSLSNGEVSHGMSIIVPSSAMILKRTV